MASNAPPPNTPGRFRLPWFSTNGQIADLALKVLLAALAGTRAWEQMRHNEFLSAGALLFYGLVATLLISVGMVLRALQPRRDAGAPHTSAPPVSVKEVSPAPAPVLSPADRALLTRAQDDLRRLSLARRVAVRLIYESPGDFSGAYIRRLEEFGFADAEQAFKPLMGETVLVECSPHMHLSQSPHTLVRQLVQEEMAKPSWAGI